jgi:nucleotide-binding universal stress UspA family protein
MSRIRRILHPSDFSRASAAAFTKAVDLANANKAELRLVHGLAPTLPMLGDGYVSPKVYEDLVASARGYGKKNLDALVAKAKKAGGRAKSVLLGGVAHEQIARTARRLRADLVVMGTQGRTGLAKLFVGSVAGRVVAIAPCPVMTRARNVATSP